MEAVDMVITEPDLDLALEIMGGSWTMFKQTIPEVQAKVLVSAFNLILLTDGVNPVMDDYSPLDEDSVINRPSGLITYQIGNLLVDEAVDIAEKKLRVYEILLEGVLNLLRLSGFTINEEMVTTESLPALCKIGSFLFDIQGYQDLIGMAGILESSDIDPVERYLLCLHKYMGDEYDIEPFYLLLSDVSEVTLKIIRNGLEGEPDGDVVPESLIARVRANRDLLEGTLALQHIRLNGQLGGSLESFLNFFSGELAPLTENLTGETVLAYLKELIGFYLVSEVNSPAIKERLIVNIHNWVDDPMVLMQAETLLDKLVLDV